MSSGRNQCFEEVLTSARVLASVAAFALFFCAPASGAVITMTFDGLADSEAVGAYYAGKLGGNGSGPGPSWGVTYTGATAKIAIANGGTGMFTGELSSPAAAFADSIMEIDVPGGFSGALSFWYSSSGGTLTVRVLSDLNLAGTILGESNLPLTASGGFAFSNVLFDAQAKSVGFVTRGPGGFYLDNVTLQTPEPVPEPGTFLLLSSALFLACASSAFGIRKRGARR